MISFIITQAKLEQCNEPKEDFGIVRGFKTAYFCVCAFQTSCDMRQPEA